MKRLTISLLVLSIAMLACGVSAVLPVAPTIEAESQKTGGTLVLQVEKAIPSVQYIVLKPLHVRNGAGEGFAYTGFLKADTLVTVTRYARARDGGRWGFVGNGWINMKYVRQK